jgi:hypothetical protein
VDVLVNGLLLAAAAMGVATAVFGSVVLTTGRAPARTLRSFGTPRRAGLWALCQGTGIALLSLGAALTRWHVWVGVALIIVAAGLVALAAVRWLPRA